MGQHQSAASWVSVDMILKDTSMDLEKGLDGVPTR